MVTVVIMGMNTNSNCGTRGQDHLV